MNPTLSTPQLCEFSGLTYRRVDYYCRAGVFGRKNVSPGSGGRRRFEIEDALIAGALSAVSEYGGLLCNQPPMLSCPLASSIAEAIRLGEGSLLMIEPSGNVYVSTQTDRVWMGSGVLIVDLSKLSADLQLSAA